MMGAHYAPPSWVVPSFRTKGYHVVSLAYRLAPHVKLSTMVADCITGFGWCLRNLPTLLQGKIDLKAFAVGGDSAGGTLATLLGLALQPRPSAVVDVYGAVDLVTAHQANSTSSQGEPWASRWGTRYSLESNETAIRDAQPKDALSIAPFGWEINHIPPETTGHRWGLQSFEYTPRIEFQTQLCDYVLSHGLLLRIVLGLNSIPESGWVEEIRRQSPLHLVTSTSSYPPTAILHGEEDTLSIDQSRELARVLRAKNVPTIELYEPDVPHAFDQLYTVRQQPLGKN